jgi:hypothetical protein
MFACNQPAPSRQEALAGIVFEVSSDESFGSFRA